MNPFFRLREIHWSVQGLCDCAYDSGVGFRFYKRLHLLPGISINLSRSGPSVSVGVRGAHVTVGRRGVTKTVGIPGSGLFYTSRQGYHTGYHSAASHVAPTTLTTPPVKQAGRSSSGLILLLVVLGLGLLFLLLR